MTTLMKISRRLKNNAGNTSQKASMIAIYLNNRFLSDLPIHFELPEASHHLEINRFVLDFYK